MIMANQQFKQEIVADGKTFIVEGSIGIDDVKVTLKDGTPVPDPRIQKFSTAWGSSCMVDGVVMWTQRRGRL